MRFEYAHTHGPGCGHPGIFHAGHTDYLVDGRLHHPTRGGVEDHVLPIGPSNPDACTRHHACGAHPPDHAHGPGCGHPAVPHGDHIDYWIDGHLHHPHGAHCDDHGPITKGAW